MKTSLKMLLMATLVVSLGTVAQAKAKKAKVQTVKFLVNLHCDECKQKIENSIPFEKGVKNLEVNMENNSVTIHYQPKKNNEEELKKALQNLDFQVKKTN